ncbi:MAG: ASCH domain-containing protein [Candidatus Bathyarchaeia archaeon]|nr:ASCH domain-containing protein [Candidatus Bathyarchaeota archaeon]
MTSRIKTLNFSKEYKEKLLSGEKTSTLRLKTLLKKGDLVNIVVGGENLGIAKIIQVKKITLKELSINEIKKDGFKSKKHLLKALKKHYPSINLTEQTPLYLITFAFQSK